MRVDVGAALPEATAPDEALPGIAGLARLAERAGLDCLWAGDRLVAGQMSVLDSSLTLAAAAAVTDRIAIGFSVYVPSLRPLAWAAKQIASLQHIAGSGRLRLGVGLGGGPAQEYHAAGFRREHRARRTDEFLRLLPGLLGGQPTRSPMPRVLLRSRCGRPCRCRRCGSAASPQLPCGVPSASAMAGCPASRPRVRSRPAQPASASSPTRPGGPGPGWASACTPPSAPVPPLDWPT
jgi:alkanesulfonate monooxygenase SsuD/methylene tetrahydromethanopterin reductase-like flavin-dependent oxidoreductase (luciferase family)